MDYISVKEFAEKYGISERTARHYVSVGRVSGAFRTGKTWNVPADAPLPECKNLTVSPLLARLREEKESCLKGGICHRVQVELTYSSNHIEGSRLTKDQTRYIFETNTLGVTMEPTNIDDILETVNHFRCVDYVIDHATEAITETHLKGLHAILKTGTSDSRKARFAVGEYKTLPNEVGGGQTMPPEEVRGEIKTLLAEFEQKCELSLDEMLDFHVRFERIHPFQDGNGRVGRLLLFWQCLRGTKVVPFVLTEELRLFYYRGIQDRPRVKGYLRDTCLTAQDSFKAALDYFRISY